MRVFARSALIATAVVPLAFLAAGPASAAEATDVSYAFSVDGTTLTNTITNNSGTALTCSTSAAPAPGGVLPAIDALTAAGQTVYESGEIAPGVSTQAVTDIPAGSYAALATCARQGADPARWASDYPGLPEILAQFPDPGFAVGESSKIVKIAAEERPTEVEPGPAPAPDAAPSFADLLRILGLVFGS